jgi:hypothetical protein
MHNHTGGPALKNVAITKTTMPSNEPRRSQEYARSVGIFEKRKPTGDPANRKTVITKDKSNMKINKLKMYCSVCPEKASAPQR